MESECSTDCCHPCCITTLCSLQITRPTVQDDWEAGDIELSIAGSAAPLGVNPSTADLRPQLAVNRSVIPDQRKTMTVTIVSDMTSVSSAGVLTLDLHRRAACC
jgi:hypothetical protein